ncbi:MAG: tRNA N6-adenosine threonylcarbamoyltransferase, partial [Verrucomicrobiota bacterium]
MRRSSQHLNASTSQLLLALETSCDETAVAILRGRRGHSELLASEVASQVAEHEKYGGVVPEVASRNHLVHAPRLLERATLSAKIDMSNVDAFAATSGPGLASSLMIGASIAKGLAIGFEKPYLAVNHLEGHLLSPFFPFGNSPHPHLLPTGEKEPPLPSGEGWGEGPSVCPNVSLIVSGGHTMSIFVRGVGDYEIIGRTVDDAAGEAFDKVAKLLGLGYPGGPEIEKHARGGNPKRFDFPRSMLDSDNFSFSGLKTAVRYLLPKLAVIPNAGNATREERRPHIRSNDIVGSRRDPAPSEGSLAFARDDRL